MSEEASYLKDISGELKTLNAHLKALVILGQREAAARIRYHRQMLAALRSIEQAAAKETI